MNSGMFRGSSYSIQTERDLSLSNVSQENIKIALVGVAQVGKSSIINAIEKEKFNEDIDPTIAFQLRFKKIKINRHLMVNLTIWDASGFRVPQYIKEGKLKSFDGIFYVYDLKSPSSVIQLQQFHEQINRLPGEHVEIIIGNKADLAVEQDSKTKEYKIPQSNEAFYLGNKFSQRHKVIHQNVSAKLNTHITDIFVLMITEILLKKRQLKISRFEEEEQSLHAQQVPKETRCKLCQNCDKCGLI